MEQGRRIVFPQPRQVEWETFSLPERPGPTELLLRARSTLINAGTDVAIYTGTHIRIGKPGFDWPRFPHHPGGSFVGEVIDMGEKVSGFALGDRVLTGATHGTHAVVDVADGRAVLVLPKELSDEAALMASHSTISLHGIRLARLQLGESVGIFGQGLIGLSALQYARIAGAGLIVAVDLIPHRLAVACSCGADITLNPKQDPIQAQIKEITGGKGLAVVVEATGNPQVIPTALRVAAVLGRVIVLGSPRGTVELDLYNELHRKGISLIGAHTRSGPAMASPHTPWTRLANRQLAMRYVTQGRLQVEGVISRLPAAVSIYDELIDHPERYVGVVLDWRE